MYNYFIVTFAKINHYLQNPRLVKIDVNSPKIATATYLPE